MRKFIIGGILTAVLFALPTVASAHSGSVTCNATGVVFHYNADFPVTTVVTERVDSTSKSFVVHAHTPATDTLFGYVGTVVASSTWVGGGTIPPTTLTCPSPPPPPPTCAEGDTSQGIVNGVLVCNHNTVVTIPGPPVYITVPGPPVVPPMGVCPKGTKNIGQTNGVLTCLKTVIKTKVKTKVQWRVKYIQWCKLPPKKGHPELG